MLISSDVEYRLESPKMDATNIEIITLPYPAKENNLMFGIL